jgi:hypothetical protein
MLGTQTSQWAFGHLCQCLLGLLTSRVLQLSEHPAWTLGMKWTLPRVQSAGLGGPRDSTEVRSAERTQELQAPGLGTTVTLDPACHLCEALSGLRLQLL